ncbi:MAG: RIP metalloprotease RseP [Burkholderiales bacterium]
MSILYTLAAFIVALGLLIVVHEFGHYLVARLCGVKVTRFSVGFGRPIWVRRLGRDQTEWVVAAVPLGGYVKMVDEREGPVAPSDLPRAFNRQGVWRRIAIVCAGPVANFLLAIALYWVLFLAGIQEAKPLLGAPDPGTPAAAAGVKRGDLVRSVNGQSTTSWGDVRWRLLDLALERRDARLEVLEDGRTLRLRTLDLASPEGPDLESDFLVKLGLRLDRPLVPPVIDTLTAGGPAEKAGLHPGDRILSIDGEPIDSWSALVRKVRANPGQTLNVRIERDAGERQVTLVPESVTRGDSAYGRIGAGSRIDPDLMRDYLVEVRYPPVEALGRATAKTWEMSVFSLRMLWRMVTGSVSWRNLSGPVTIADYAGQSAQLGLAPYLAFLALISISLGVLNLLPIPMLDGGHLMYYSVEILKGSPVSDRVMELGQRIGLTLLLCLMAFAFYNDINRLLSS